MPAVLLLASAVVMNYWQFKRRRPTICQTFRRAVPRPVGAAFLVALFGWLFPHVLLGYPKRALEAVQDALDDASDCF